MLAVATSIAADLIQTAGFGAESVYGNLGIPAKLVADRRFGVAWNQMYAAIPWVEAAGRACGVCFDQRERPAEHAGRIMDGWVSSQEIDDRIRDVAKCKSSSHLMVHKLIAYNVRFEDTRSPSCVGFLIRSCFRSYSQLPCFSAPTIEEMPGRTVLGGIAGSGEEEQDGEVVADVGDKYGGCADPRLIHTAKYKYSRLHVYQLKSRR